MSALAELQREFQAYLLGGNDSFAAEILSTGRASAEERLRIYADAYQLRLREALETDFKALRFLMGPEAFGDMSRSYVETHPSRHPSIRWFGRHLPEFLQIDPSYASTPMLAEMASFEWALSLCFDAADDETVSVDDIACVPPDAWPGMTFRFHPSVQRLDLRWNIPPVWRAVEHQAALPEPQRSEWPVGWVIWRKQRNPRFRSLEVDELWAMDAAHEGEGFATICEGLCEWVDAENAPLHAAGMLKSWINEGLIARIEDL